MADHGLLSSDYFQKSDTTVCIWEKNSGERCGAVVFRDFGSCLAHVVETWWENIATQELGLGRTWEKGIGVAVNWYAKNPDALVEQIAALQDKADDEDAKNRCAKCGEPFDANLMNYQNSGRCLGCTFQRQETAPASEPDLENLSEIYLRFRAATRELGRYNGSKYNVGALLRDVNSSAIESAGETLRMPFRHHTYLNRFNGEYAEHGDVILEYIGKHLPGVTTIETTMLEEE